MMLRRPGTLLTAACFLTCLLTGLAAPAAGASRQDHADCDADDDPARSIAGCTRIIDDHSEGAKMRSTAYVGRGLAYVMEGDREDGIADFTEAIRLDPKNVYAYNNRGLAFKAKGDLDRAIADLTAAIKIDPLPHSDLPGSGFVSIYANRGLAFEAKGDLDRAIADFDEALRRAPRDADAFNRRGAAWRVKGEPDRAIADFTLAIAADPRFADAYFNRGLIRKAQNIPDLALTDFSDAIRLDPTMLSAYYQRAQIHIAKKDPDPAIADLDELIRRAKSPPFDAYYLRGVARYDRYMVASAIIDPEDLKRAIADFSEAIRRSPDYRDAYRARAAAEEADGQHGRAADDRAKADAHLPILANPRDVLQ